MIRVEILDDSPVYQEGLRAVLENESMVVTTRLTTDDALSWRVDLFLVRYRADDGLLRAFVGNAARVAPVLLTGHPDDAAVEECLAIGACGLLDRGTATAEVVAAVRRVADGGQYWSRSVTPPVPDRATAPDDEALLSPRERQVMRLIARGFTHTQIATRLSISPHTVDTYVKRIRSKLSLGNKAELTRAAVLGNLTDEQTG